MSLLSRRRLMQAGVASLSLTMQAQPGAAQPASPQTLTLATNRVPSDLDPHSAYDVGSSLALRGPFEGLIRLKPGTLDEYQPVLAESWTANADQSVWSFQMRPGVTFQDGTPLDAEAARASFERLLFLNLAPATVLGRFIDDPSRIAASDSMTLTFDLGQPQPLFLTALSSSFGTAIVNARALRQHEVDGDWGHAWARSVSDGIGTGPYRITAFDLETGVGFERYADYWQGWDGQHFDRVSIRVVVETEIRRLLLERGQADIATTLPLSAVRDLEQHPDLRVELAYDMSVRYVAMTVGGPLQSAEARQALCWAFPYEEVITGVFEGFAKRAVGPVAELCRGFAPDTFVYETDLRRARSLFDQAGVGEGTPLTLAFPPGNREASVMAELFQANLASIGMPLEILEIDFATYVEIFMGDMPLENRPNLLALFWTPDYNDAWNHLWPQVSCDAWQSGNGGQYCNGQVEAWLAAASNAVDESSYMESIAQVQQTVTRDDPAAIYFAQCQTLLVLRDEIQGFVPDRVNAGIFDYYRLSRAESTSST